MIGDVIKVDFFFDMAKIIVLSGKMPTPFLIFRFNEPSTKAGYMCPSSSSIGPD